MTIKRTVGRSRRFFGPPRIRGKFAILEYRAPPGTQTIDNSEEFERVRRCAEQGILPYSRPRPSLLQLLGRNGPTRYAVLEYRAPPGTQTIDNSEEFERVRRCAEQGILPFTRPSFRRSSRHSDGSRSKAPPHQYSEERDDLSADEHRR